MVPNEQVVEVTNSFKPEGYSTVSPYLIAAGAQRVIDFLKEAFGARELRRYDLPDGSIMHAEVRIGDTVVMLDDGGRTGRLYQRICTSMWPMLMPPMNEL
jgi:hypothetical protein